MGKWVLLFPLLLCLALAIADPTDARGGNDTVLTWALGIGAFVELYLVAAWTDTWYSKTKRCLFGHTLPPNGVCHLCKLIAKAEQRDRQRLAYRGY